MPLSRRAFSATLIGAAASLSAGTRAAPAAPVKAQNVVLVHGLFADGSCWSDVIARLQAAGLNVTAVQSPLTTLPDAVAAVERVLARQDGPTVLAGHSFAGMIVTEAGMQPGVAALVYVAARAPDAGEDYAQPHALSSFITPNERGLTWPRRRPALVPTAPRPGRAVLAAGRSRPGQPGPSTSGTISLTNGTMNSPSARRTTSRSWP